MSILRKGREALGWSLERMATNVCITPAELEQIEASGFVDRDNITVRSILSTFQIRNVEIEGDDVVGPLDDASLRDLRLSKDDIADLKRIERGGKFGITVNPSMLQSSMRAAGLLQFSSVRTTTHLNFEGEAMDLRENTAEIRARLSKRGSAALDFYCPKNAATVQVGAKETEQP